jgi:hypothetical protein
MRVLEIKNMIHEDWALGRLLFQRRNLQFSETMIQSVAYRVSLVIIFIVTSFLSECWNFSSVQGRRERYDHLRCNSHKQFCTRQFKDTCACLTSFLKRKWPLYARIILKSPIWCFFLTFYSWLGEESALLSSFIDSYRQYTSWLYSFFYIPNKA